MIQELTWSSFAQPSIPQPMREQMGSLDWISTPGVWLPHQAQCSSWLSISGSVWTPLRGELWTGISAQLSQISGHYLILAKASPRSLPRSVDGTYAVHVRAIYHSTSVLKLVPGARLCSNDCSKDLLGALARSVRGSSEDALHANVVPHWSRSAMPGLYPHQENFFLPPIQLVILSVSWRFSQWCKDQEEAAISFVSSASNLPRAISIRRNF